MNSIDFFYDVVLEKLRTIEFINDEVLKEFVEILLNKVDGAVDVDSINSVYDIAETISNALSSSNFYVNRGIDIDKHASTIESLLLSLDEYLAILKKDKQIANSTETKVKERLINSDINTKNSVDNLYQEDKTRDRLPNSTSRFH